MNDNGTNFAWYGANGLNQYTSVGGLGLSYDGNFNLTGYNGASFAYNAASQLVSASKNGNTVQFTYDGLGRCVRRTVNGAARLVTYDGWKPMLEFDGAGNWLHWNMYGAGPDEILARNDGLLYKQDQRGNVVALLGPSNNILEKYTYDAFGKPTITDANGNVRTETPTGIVSCSPAASTSKSWAFTITEIECITRRLAASCKRIRSVLCRRCQPLPILWRRSGEQC